MSRQHQTTNIYISYAYVDNQNFENDDRGWITAFKDDLENEISFLIGKILPITIFRDKQFESPSLLTVKYIRATDVFIVIGTPAYFLSDFCQKELRLFQNRDDIIPNERIIIADKKPFEDHSLSTQIPLNHFLPFYDLENGNEWNRKVEAEMYHQQIKKLAEQIKGIL